MTQDEVISRIDGEEGNQHFVYTVVKPLWPNQQTSANTNGRIADGRFIARHTQRSSSHSHLLVQSSFGKKDKSALVLVNMETMHITIMMGGERDWHMRQQLTWVTSRDHSTSLVSDLSVGKASNGTNDQEPRSTTTILHLDGHRFPLAIMAIRSGSLDKSNDSIA